MLSEKFCVWKQIIRTRNIQHLLSPSEILLVDAMLPSLVLHVDMSDALYFRRNGEFFIFKSIRRISGRWVGEVISCRFVQERISLSAKSTTEWYVAQFNHSNIDWIQWPYATQIQMFTLTLNSIVPNSSFVVRVVSASSRSSLCLCLPLDYRCSYFSIDCHDSFSYHLYCHSL